MTRSVSGEQVDEAIGHDRRYLILTICALSLLIVGIDSTGVNLALPDISRELGATDAQLQWVVDAYTLVLAAGLMLGGSMGDRFGRRRVFQIGLTMFGLGSLLCSLAPNPELLIASRAAQAVGGCMLNPVAMAIITNTFREPGERAKAIGIWGAVFGVSMALGPVVGGALIAAIDWRAIFWLNIPIVVIATSLTAKFVPESRADRVRRFDPAGQLLVIVFLTTLVFAIIEGRRLGWTSPAIVGCFAVAAVSLLALVLVESRVREPLIDPRFFRSVTFSGAVVSAVLAFCAMGGFLFLTSVYLQNSRGLSALHAGLMTLPMALVMAVCAPISGRLVAARGARLPTLIGGLATAVAGLLLVGLAADTAWAYLLVAYMFFGLGAGLLNAPITNSAVAGMPRSQAGVAAAIASTSRQVGTSLGVAILPAVTYAGLDAAHGDFAVASRPAWAITAAIGLILAVVALVIGSAWAVRSQGRVADLFD